MYHIITFDLIDPDTHDYKPIYKKIENHFLDACHILSTTCIIKSNKNAKDVESWILKHIDDTKIRFFVSEYTPQKKGYYLPNSVANCVEKLEKS